MRKILVGQQPGGYNDCLKHEYKTIDDRIIKERIVAPEPLWAGKAGSTGYRIAMLSNLEVSEYHRTFQRVNVLPVSSGGTFRVTPYTKAMGRYLRKSFVENDMVVCLGHEVMTCLGLDLEDRFTFYPDDNGVLFAYMPHPSGLNRWFNDRENWDAAAEFMTALAYYPEEYVPPSDEE